MARLTTALPASRILLEMFKVCKLSGGAGLVRAHRLATVNAREPRRLANGSTPSHLKRFGDTQLSSLVKTFN